MTAEKQPNIFMVIAKGIDPVIKDGFALGQDGSQIFSYYDFDEAIKGALSYYKKYGVPCEICMLSSLTGAITPESLDSPMLDYVPQNIKAIENAYINAGDNEEAGKVMEVLKRFAELLARTK